MYVGGGFRGEDMGFFFLGNMAWKAREGAKGKPAKLRNFKSA
jgi:hypothetical protein